MSETHDWRRILRRWWLDVSANAIGGILAALILALFAAAIAASHPLRAWLSGRVFLWGWALVVAIGAAGLTGYCIAWWRYRRAQEDLSDSPFSSGASIGDLAPFEPSDLERRAIRLLRIADGKWVNFETIAENLAVGSQQDLHQALKRLAGIQWIEGHKENFLKHERAYSFRLADAGITFAREHGYETLTEIERNRSKGS